MPLKTEIDIEEAVKSITKAIKNAAWQATPDRKEQNFKEERPMIVKQKITGKRKTRKRLQLTRAPQTTKIQQASKITKKFVTQSQS